MDGNFLEEAMQQACVSEQEDEGKWPRPLMVHAERPRLLPTSQGTIYGQVGYAKLHNGLPAWYGAIYTKMQQPEDGDGFIGQATLVLPAYQVQFPTQGSLVPYSLLADIRFGDRVRQHLNKEAADLLEGLYVNWGYLGYTDLKAIDNGGPFPPELADQYPRFVARTDRNNLCSKAERAVFETIFGTQAEATSGLKLFPHQIVRSKTFDLVDFHRDRTIIRGMDLIRQMLYAIDELVVTRQTIATEGMLDDYWLPDPPPVIRSDPRN